MNRGWYKFPLYLAIEPKTQTIYRVPSWISVTDWVEIPSSNLKFYTAEGDILSQYVSKPYYKQHRGSIRMKPR